MTLGDLNTTWRPPKPAGLHIPAKILCAAFQMQYHKPKQPVDPKEWNNTRQIKLDEVNEKTSCCIKAVSQLSVYTLYSRNANNDNNDKKNNNEK